MLLFFLFQECHDQGVSLSLNAQGGLHFKSSNGKMTEDLKNQLKEHKAEIIKYLQESLNNGFHPTPFSTLSSEEITRYRFLLEDSYGNPAFDHWHGDGMPQRFREGLHTFEEMEKALVKFICRTEQGDHPQLGNAREKPVDTLPISDNPDQHKAAITDFMRSRKLLPEYHAWEKMCKLLTENPQDEQVKKACSLASEAFLKACKALPEWLPFLEAKIDQYLAKSLEGYSLSL
jgi:hypothetical protein